MRNKRDRQKSHRAGLLAELFALSFLCAKLYRPVAWRAKTPVGEIDLIVVRGSTLAFVEVKQRRLRDDAAFAVHERNQSRVMRAAQYLLSQHPEWSGYQVRFDVCLVAWYRFPHHIPHAFESA